MSRFPIALLTYFLLASTCAAAPGAPAGNPGPGSNAATKVTVSFGPNLRNPDFRGRWGIPDTAGVASNRSDPPFDRISCTVLGKGVCASTFSPDASKGLVLKFVTDPEHPAGPVDDPRLTFTWSNAPAEPNPRVEVPLSGGAVGAQLDAYPNVYRECACAVCSAVDLHLCTSVTKPTAVPPPGADIDSNDWTDGYCAAVPVAKPDGMRCDEVGTESQPRLPCKGWALVRNKADGSYDWKRSETIVGRYSNCADVRVTPVGAVVQAILGGLVTPSQVPETVPSVERVRSPLEW